MIYQKRKEKLPNNYYLQLFTDKNLVYKCFPLCSWKFYADSEKKKIYDSEFFEMQIWQKKNA